MLRITLALACFVYAGHSSLAAHLKEQIMSIVPIKVEAGPDTESQYDLKQPCSDRQAEPLKSFANLLLVLNAAALWQVLGHGPYGNLLSANAEKQSSTKETTRVETSVFRMCTSDGLGAIGTAKMHLKVKKPTSAIDPNLLAKAVWQAPTKNPPAWHEFAASIVDGFDCDTESTGFATSKPMGFGARKSLGFGVSKPTAPTRVKLPGLRPAVQKALSAKVEALLESTSDPYAWFEVGAVLYQASEYAEAERFFRAGAVLAPGDNMLVGAAKTLGGDSAAYHHRDPPARLPVLSGSLHSPLDKVASDEEFDAYALPADFFLGFDQSDRALMWSYAQEDAMARGAVFKSKKPLLSPVDCRWVVEEAEKHAKKLGGWSTSRHHGAPTTDIPVSQIPMVREWFNNQLRDVFFPMLQARYPSLIASSDELRVLDAFIVRYDAGEQASLPVHKDESTFSFTIALNDRKEYEGGGTSFEAIRPLVGGSKTFAPGVLNANMGGVVTFPGKLLHGGNTITNGRRYIISLFIYADVNYSGMKPGYLLERLNLSEAYPEAATALMAQKKLLHA